jgi:hypothetical protein
LLFLIKNEKLADEWRSVGSPEAGRYGVGRLLYALPENRNRTVGPTHLQTSIQKAKLPDRSTGSSMRDIGRVWNQCNCSPPFVTLPA